MTNKYNSVYSAVEVPLRLEEEPLNWQVSERRSVIRSLLGASSLLARAGGVVTRSVSRSQRSHGRCVRVGNVDALADNSSVLSKRPL